MRISNDAQAIIVKKRDHLLFFSLLSVLIRKKMKTIIVWLRAG